MLKRIVCFSVILSLIIPVFSLNVSAEELHPYIPVTDEIKDELFFISSYFGAFFDSSVSIEDIVKTRQEHLSDIDTQLSYLRWNSESNCLEVRSGYRHDDLDSIEYPSEFLNDISVLVSDCDSLDKNSNFLLNHSLYVPEENDLSVQDGSSSFVPKCTMYIYNSSGNRIYKCNVNYSYMTEYSFSASSRFFGVVTKLDTGRYGLSFYSFLTTSTTAKPTLTSLNYVYYDINGNVKNYNKSLYGISSDVLSYSTNFPVFSSIEEGKNWALGGASSNKNNSFQTVVYRSNVSSRPVTKSLKVSNNSLSDNDWKEINNNTYNEINNYYYSNNDELENKINDSYNSICNIVNNYIVTSSGDDTGSGGTGSGDTGSSGAGCACPDYTGDFDELQTTVEDIYNKLDEFFDTYSKQEFPEIDLSNIENALSALDELLQSSSQDHVKALEDIYSKLDEILEEFQKSSEDSPTIENPDYTSQFDELQIVLDEIKTIIDSNYLYINDSLSDIYNLIEESSSQNKTFFDIVSDKLDSIIKYLKRLLFVDVIDTIADIDTALKEFVQQTIGIVHNETSTVVNKTWSTITSRATIIANVAKSKFPFCLPFDLYATLAVFSAPARVPRYDIPFEFNVFGQKVENTLIINIADFEKLATYSRYFFTVLFIYGLIMLSMKIFKGGSNDD